MLEKQELKKLATYIVDEMDSRYSAELAHKWEGATIKFIPEDENMSEHEMSIEKLLQKIIRVRENLRVLEQQVNSNKNLSETEKVKLQGYVTKCYGSLTSFNFLFYYDDDKFKSKKD